VCRGSPPEPLAKACQSITIDSQRSSGHAPFLPPIGYQAPQSNAVFATSDECAAGQHKIRSVPKKLKPRSFAPAELQQHADHIRYELEMLVFTAIELGGGHSSPKSPPDGIRKNVALESFLIHFRNLRDFLCPSGFVDDNDLFASDFLGSDIPIDVANRDKVARRCDPSPSLTCYPAEESRLSGRIRSAICMSSSSSFQIR
jgi:hypothetical protein